jgi:CDP-paratose 2-epimerase
MRTVLVTGGAGFIGTNTADRLLRDGHRVRILDSLARDGVERNLQWLERRHGPRLEVEIADVREPATVRRAVRGVDSVFHFAAQVAVTTSLDDPIHDAHVNVQGTLNLLEALRCRTRPPAVVFTSTNKVYGALGDIELEEHRHRYDPADPVLRRSGVAENRPLAFCTPYGCSKGAADQYVVDWAVSFGVPTVVFRMSCIYGPHQFGTEDQGWVAHFLISALEGEPITLYGDGKQVRDVLFVDDLVDALTRARAAATRLAGRAFNIGGGPTNSVSLREAIDMIATVSGTEPTVRMDGWRRGDQRYYVSDTGAFTFETGWHPRVSPQAGIERLHDWLVAERAAAAAAAAA